LAVQAGAAATLTGLVFVALSINLTRIVTFPGLPGRAAESMLHFLEVFLIATMALIPSQPGPRNHRDRLRALAGATTGATPVFAAEARTSVVVVCGPLRSEPSCDRAVLCCRHGFIFSFIAGGIGAWVLLVEILR
jgi:hypothetical protein